eukprot:XP_025011141.1 uncharacterized protein LOC101747516 isoform X4 [Gallus gallus]
MRWPLFFACFLSFSACLCGACSLAIPPTALHRLSPRAVQVLRRPEPPLSRQEAFAGAADRSGWEQEQERRPSLEAPRAAALDGPPEPPSQHCPRARPVALRTPLSSLPSAGWWCCEQRPTKPTAPLSRAQIYLGNSVTRRESWLWDLGPLLWSKSNSTAKKGWPWFEDLSFIWTSVHSGCRTSGLPLRSSLTMSRWSR